MKRNDNDNGKRPVYAKRCGAVRVAVWEQTADSGSVFHNVAVARRYKDEAGEWKETNSLNGLGDIAAAMLALKLVAEWVSAREDQLAAEEVD